jgi:hypothetical protein
VQEELISRAIGALLVAFLHSAGRLADLDSQYHLSTTAESAEEITFRHDHLEL